MGYCVINFPAVSFFLREWKWRLKKSIKSSLLVALVPIYTFGQGNLDPVFDAQERAEPGQSQQGKRPSGQSYVI